MDRQWRCAYCGEIVGVYEPMVVLLPSGSRATSRAAELDLKEVPEASFHEACFESARGTPAPEGQSEDAAPTAGG